MARAIFVAKAQKDNPVAKKGESYYYWKFFRGGKHYSKTQPKPSQLTGSAFLGSVLGALEGLEDLSAETPSADLAAAIREAGEAVQEAADETQSSLDNMPEGLQQGDTGQMMEQRVSDAGDLASELESKAGEMDDAETEEDRQSILEDVQGLSYEGE